MPGFGAEGAEFGKGAASGPSFQVNAGTEATTTLLDAGTNNAPILQVLKHLTSAAGALANFGLGAAIDLANGVDAVVRAMTDIVSWTVPTSGAEEAMRVFRLIVAGALAQHSQMSWVGSSASNPAFLLGNPASLTGLLRATNNLQIVIGSAVLDMTNASLTSLVRHVFSARMQQGQGASIPSAATLTLGADGNVFPISGVTTINGITTATWTAGAVVYLKFAGILTLTHNSGAPGGGAVALKTTTSANVATTANSISAFMFDGTFWNQLYTITPGY